MIIRTFPACLPSFSPAQGSTTMKGFLQPEEQPDKDDDADDDDDDAF